MARFDVLEFSAEWCPPRLDQDKLGVPVIHVDVDRDTGSALIYEVEKITTAIIRKDGQEIARLKRGSVRIGKVQNLLQ